MKDYNFEEFYMDWLDDHEVKWLHQYPEENWKQMALDDFLRLSSDLAKHPWDCKCLLCR